MIYDFFCNCPLFVGHGTVEEKYVPVQVIVMIIWAYVETWGLLHKFHHTTDLLISIFTYCLYWCHDRKHIVPVTVQVWDCLSSPLEATLVPNRVPVMNPWERPILVSQVVVPQGIKGLCSSGTHVVLVKAVDVGVPLLRVWKCEYSPLWVPCREPCWSHVIPIHIPIHHL